MIMHTKSVLKGDRAAYSPRRYWPIGLIAFVIAELAHAPLIGRVVAGSLVNIRVNASQNVIQDGLPIGVPEGKNLKPRAFAGDGGETASNASFRPDYALQSPLVLETSTSPSISLTSSISDINTPYDFSSGLASGSSAGADSSQLLFSGPPISVVPDTYGGNTGTAVGSTPPRVTVGIPAGNTVPEPGSVTAVLGVSYMVGKRRRTR